MREYIERHSLKRADDISKNTVKKVRTVISEGVRTGKTTDQIAKKIGKVIDNPSRARAIARTEVHTAQGYAQDREAEQHEGRVVRVWTTADDSKVRPTHAAADGQRRPLHKPFKVGRSSLMYPGDPTAPAEEIINCRCVLLYETEK